MRAEPKPLSVAHYVAEYPSATETFVAALLREASDVRREVWTQRRVVTEEEPDGPAVHELGVGARGLRVWFERLHAVRHGFESREELRLFRRLRRHPAPDLVHAHFGPQGFAAARPCSRLNIPVFTSFYGFDLALADNSSLWRRRYASLWRLGAAFLAEGPHMRRHLVGLGAPDSKTHVQALPVDLSRIAFQARHRHGGEPVRLVQVARLIEKKGVDLAIGALSDLLGRGHRVSLDIVGDGPLRSNLEQLARAQNVASAVRFLGLTSHERVRGLLLDAHLLVQPSRTARNGDTEGGAPYILLEAQASGMCVAASAHADIPSSVHPDAWFGFAENDRPGVVAAIERAIAVANEWPARGLAARAFVELHHDPRRLVSALNQQYRASLTRAASAM